MTLRNRKAYELNMTDGPILPTLLQFTFPLMFSGILQLLFNAADIVVVGRYAGDNALAAVGSNTSLINLLINLFMGLSVGSNILASRQYGARDREGMEQTVHTSILLSLVSGAVLAIAGVMGARTFLTWMQSPPEVLDLATVYLRIFFLGMPATMLYNFGSALLRAVGDTRRPLNYLFIAGVINVVLNLYFVIVLDMDVAGVGWATVISQCVSAFLVLRCMVKDTGWIHLDLRKLQFHKVRVKQILQTGLPAGFQGILFAMSNVIIQSQLNSFGEIVVAGNAAASNIETFVYNSMNAVYQANMSITSANLGAGRIDRIRPVAWRSQVTVLTIGVLMGGTAAYFGPQLLHIYSDSPAVIAAGMDRMMINCLLFALCGIMDVMVGSIRGIGYSVMPMLVSLLGVCGVRLVWVYTVFQIPAYHPPRGIYWSYPLSWTFTFLVHLLCFTVALRRLRRTMRTSEPITPEFE